MQAKIVWHHKKLSAVQILGSHLRGDFPGCYLIFATLGLCSGQVRSILSLSEGEGREMPNPISPTLPLAARVCQSQSVYLRVLWCAVKI